MLEENCLEKNIQTQLPDSYHSLRVTHHQLGDYIASLQSKQHALDVIRKLFGEEHADTALSYHSLGIRQRQFGDYTSALQSHQHALVVRRKLFAWGRTRRHSS